MITDNKDEYSARWAEVTPGELKQEGPAPIGEMALGWSDGEEKPESFKLAGDGVSIQTHKAMRDAGIDPDQEAIEHRANERAKASEEAGAPKGQVGTTSISSAAVDKLAKILAQRDPRMSPQSAKEMAIRMHAEKGVRAFP